MKKLFFFPFLLFEVIISLAWQSLKEWFDPVTVDHFSRNDRRLKFNPSTGSYDFMFGRR